MAIINHAKREINAKIVFYGHEGGGKATSLRYLHERIKPSLRSELKSQPASGGSLLFFDFCPFENPVFGGYRVRFHIYTLPGRVINPAAWKMTLKGADGLVLVIDAAPGARSAGRQSMTQLRDYLASYGMGLNDIPSVLQVNKADLAENVSAEAIAAQLELGNIPACLTTAFRGKGVLEALSTLSRQVMSRLGQENIPQPTNETIATAAEAEQTIPPQTGTAGEAQRKDTRDETTDAPLSEQSGGLQVALAGTPVSDTDGTVRIPLAVSLDGQTRRFVVSIAVEPERGTP